MKGDLNNFTVRPGTRRNFIGVAGGASAIPRDTNTAINSFFLTVEPLVDIQSVKYNWKLSLGAPLQFELADLRGPFETCIAEAKVLRSQGQSQSAIENSIPVCMNDKKGQITQNLGKLRREDWDEASDFAKIIRHVVVGGQEQPFYLSLSRLYDQSFGHGTVVRSYNPNIDYNTARLGANLDFSRAAIGVQAMANDLVRPDVVGLLGFVRPFRPYSDNVMLRSLSFGMSWLRGGNQPLGLRYERGLFRRSYDQLIPEVDSNLDLQGSAYHQASIIGFDVEAKVLRSDWADVKIYGDFDKMLSYDSGLTLGSLWRFSFGQPAHQAVRARTEVSMFGPAYLPSYFDTFHDIFQYQYLPAGYRSSRGLQYYPTKLEYLEASRPGRKRVGRLRGADLFAARPVHDRCDRARLDAHGIAAHGRLRRPAVRRSRLQLPGGKRQAGLRQHGLDWARSPASARSACTPSCRSGVSSRHSPATRCSAPPPSRAWAPSASTATTRSSSVAPASWCCHSSSSRRRDDGTSSCNVSPMSTWRT